VTAGHPKEKPTLYTHNHTSCAKGISPKSALASKWVVLQHQQEGLVLLAARLFW